MKLAEIREKYPEYDHVDDQTLADALYTRYYSHADRREFDARIGLTPYQNALETAGTVLSNLPANLTREAQAVVQQTGEAMTEFAAPTIQAGNQPPTEFTPGAPVEEYLEQPAVETFDRSIAPGLLLPEDTRQQIGEAGARMSVAAQLRKAEAERALAANPVDARPGSPEYYLGVAAATAAEMAPGMIASVIARNPAPLAIYFGARSLGGGMAEAQAAGASVSDTAMAGALYALAEGLTEAIAGGILLEGGKTVLGSVVRGTLAEGVTEGTTEAIQALIDQGLLDANMSVEEAINRVKDAAIVGAMAGGTVAGVTKAATGGVEISPETAVTPDQEPERPEETVVAPEEIVSLPAPETPLALPSPEPAPDIRRANPAPEELMDLQAQTAIESTGQLTSIELLQTARETIMPLGTFTAEDFENSVRDNISTRTVDNQLLAKYGRDGQWHPATLQADGTIYSPGAEEDARRAQNALRSAIQRVSTWRAQTGRPMNASISIEDMARARVPQSTINTAIEIRRPLTAGESLTPARIRRAAEERNIIATDNNFKDLAYRTTGTRNLNRMSQVQLNALLATIESMPSHASPVTIPIAERPAFTEGQYAKALDAVRNQGRFTLKAVKDATGLQKDEDAKAVRDAMLRRGQLVEKKKGEYRLFDQIGLDRRPVPEDLPPGAFQEYVVKRIPVSQVQVKQDGKSIGRFDSAEDARRRVSEIRAKEAEAGKRQSSLEITDAGDVAYGIMENRYDEQGNLLGQVVVDTVRDEDTARQRASERNTPDIGARYVATPVEPSTQQAPARPRKQPPPPALEGRLDEVMQNLNRLAKQRGLPLLGTKVNLQNRIEGPNGEQAEGVYQRDLIRIAAGNLRPEMTTAEITDALAQVMDHELIHVLYRSGVLGPETEGWKTLSNYTRRAKYPGTNETYLNRAQRQYAGVQGYDATAIEEEAIAEAFRVWAADKRAVSGRPATVFRQLIEWFRRMLNAIPVDVFEAIESGDLVRNALTPPGSSMPRARTTEAMAEAREGVKAAQEAGDEQAVRNNSRVFLRARAQAREDRFGRSGPKTVLGTTASNVYDSAPKPSRQAALAIRDKYAEKSGRSVSPLPTYLREDVDYLKRVADAQQAAEHAPEDQDVARAYRSLIVETKSMFDSLGDLQTERWVQDGAPYESAQDMFLDIQDGRLRMRVTDDIFAEGPDNLKHPLNAASGYAATDGTPLTYNDLLRVVHDVYGRAPVGLTGTPRGDYNAYHEHARLLSEDARKALATEVLAQSAWHHYGPHLRRDDGSVPREGDIDYLPPMRKEFAEQKAMLLPDELIAADPGLEVIADAEQASDVDVIPEDDTARYMLEDRLPGGKLYGNPNRSPGGILSKPGTQSPQFSAIADGNRFFGGEKADEQLGMAITGVDGATIIYLSPDEFLSLTDQEATDQQPVFDQAVQEGYKFSMMPSLVLDGYAGIVRVTDMDGADMMRALQGRANQVPVMIYPKRKESMGLVSALESKATKTKIPWPHMGRQENYLDARGAEPRYSITAPYGNRVPRDPPEAFNILDQRVEGVVGRALHNIGRSKRKILPGKTLPAIFGESIFDMRIKYQDRMLSVKEMLENMKAMGASVSDDVNVYLQEQLASGRTVHEVEEREHALYEPLFRGLQEANSGENPVTVKEFENYLYARHAPERNAYLRSRGAEAESPSGMSDEEARTILDQVALNGQLETMERLAALADRITANTTRTRVDAGLISQKAADASPYENYVPLRGRAEEDLDPDDVYTPPTRARSGKGYAISGREDRQATGRESKAGDLISHLILQNTEAVIRAEKNRVALSFMRLIQDNPDTGYGSILKKAPTRRVVGTNGMIREVGDASYRQRPDIFTAKYEGSEIVAQVNDPRVARALRADYVGSTPAWVNGLARINRYLAMVNTSLNPEFLISNLARDMQTAGIVGQQFDIKDLTKRIVTDAGPAMLGIREVLRDGTATTPMAQAFKELRATGGTTEFLGIHDLDTHVARLRKDAAATGWNATARQARNHAQNVLKFVDDYNKVAENAFRLSAYVAARDAGVSVEKAAYLAKNLTVNFNKGGENKAVMNAMYLFYNASIGGSFVLFNSLKSKRVQKIVAGVVMAGLLQDIINRAMSGDEDDNGVKDYDDIPQWVLEHNWVFMMPGTEKGYLALPMPYGFNLFHNIGRNLSAAFSGSPVHNPGKSAMSIAMTAVDAFNPMGGSESVANFIAPTIVDPFVDLIENRDFAGNQIVPERPTFGVPTPDSQKYWSNTSEIPRWVADHLNRLTGGNEVRSGWADVSPEVLQYWFDYATGATGGFVKRNYVLGENLVAGDFEDIEIGDIPFARRVVGTVNNRGNTERYYENAREVETVAEELKLAQETGDQGLFNDVLRRSQPQAELIDTFKDGHDALTELRQQIQAVRETDTLTPARQRELIRGYREEQDRIMAILNKLYFERVEGVQQP